MTIISLEGRRGIDGHLIDLRIRVVQLFTVTRCGTAFEAAGFPYNMQLPAPSFLSAMHW